MISYFLLVPNVAAFVQNWISPSSKRLGFPLAFYPGTISAGRLGKVYNFSKSSAASASAVLLIFYFI
jgi:hypothetical protein